MIQQQSILVVDDESGLRKLLNLLFINAGYTVHEASNGHECFQQIATKLPDLIVLDVMLPEMNGREVVQHIRQKGILVPILMLTARAQARDIVMGLDCGADDYMRKPFDMDELLARVRALLRRSKTIISSLVVGQGEIIINMQSHVVTVNGSNVDLTPTEYALLSVLADNVGNVVHHDTLLRAVWGEDSKHDLDHLKVYIWHLRRKIEPNAGRTPRLLLTEWGVGYRLVQ